MKSLLERDLKIMHSLMEREAQTCTPNDAMFFEDYFERHRAVRAKMLAAKTPEIREESTKVRFMLQSLRQNTKYD